MIKKLTTQKMENRFCKKLMSVGFDFASGVPCGVLKYIIRNFCHNKKIKHIPAVRESEAIGIAAGAQLAGKKPIVYMQNSGLMDSLNDVNSLLIPYKIPILFLVSYRGAPGEDAPQHLATGRSIKKVLKAIGIPVKVLTVENMGKVVAFSKEWLEEKQLPAVILIIRHTLYEKI